MLAFIGNELVCNLVCAPFASFVQFGKQTIAQNKMEIRIQISVVHQNIQIVLHFANQIALLRVWIFLYFVVVVVAAALKYSMHIDANIV